MLGLWEDDFLLFRPHVPARSGGGVGGVGCRPEASVPWVRRRMLDSWRISRKTSCPKKNNTTTGKGSGAYVVGIMAQSRGFGGLEACRENKWEQGSLPLTIQLYGSSLPSAFLHLKVIGWELEEGDQYLLTPPFFSTLH